MLYMAVVAAVVVVLAAVEKEDVIPMLSDLILSRLFLQIAFKLTAAKSPYTELQERISSMCRLNK